MVNAAVIALSLRLSTFTRMMILASVLAAFCRLALLIHLSSVIVAIVRAGRRKARCRPPPTRRPITIDRFPVCDVDNFVEETLTSSFRPRLPAL